jgi:hypothetical protein
MRRSYWGLGAAVAGALLLLSAGAPAATPRDRVRPTTPTIDGPLRPEVLRPIFTFGATDTQTPRARIRFRCGFDGAALRPCARIHRPAVALSFGKHSLRARAVDLAGNVSRVSTFAFTVAGSWDAARDFERAPRPANPGRDRYGNTAWFYLSSVNPEHEPGAYQLLPYFEVGQPGSESWRNRQGAGTGGTEIAHTSGRIVMHPGHYNLGQNAVLGWRSPLTATVRVDADLSTNPGCEVPANGVVWSIDQGAAAVRSGTLGLGQSVNRSFTVPVTAGESLYVVVNDAGDSNCDSTHVHLSIATVD